jgi:hypothetical protein
VGSKDLSGANRRKLTVRQIERSERSEAGQRGKIEELLAPAEIKLSSFKAAEPIRLTGLSRLTQYLRLFAFRASS